ncbi:hypothetical protein TWF696_002717 [Orbilia brochopaga]|uniref:Uncharacterized protein n=1 Tax=Orbilia brochopaga TaxID=3140254 RepID=A0AAV9U352_9PEZI
MGSHRFGPIEMEDSFIYTFFPLLGLIFAILYFKSQDMTKGIQRDASPSSTSFQKPDAKVFENQTVKSSTEPTVRQRHTVN